MTFDKRTISLISLGSSVAANCKPCLEYHTTKALDVGLTNQEIMAAIEIGRSVRKGAYTQMDQLIANLNDQSHVDQPQRGLDCGCMISTK